MSASNRARYIAEGGLALLLIIVGVVLFVRAPTLVAGWAFNIPGTTDVALAPVFFPRLAAILLALAALSIILTMRGRTAPLPLLETGRDAYLKVAAGLAGIFALIVLVPIVGFVTTSALFIFIATALGGYRRWVILVPVAILTPVILWLVFRYGLHVGLPHGAVF